MDKKPCSEYVIYNYAQCMACTTTKCVICNLIAEIKSLGDEIKKLKHKTRSRLGPHTRIGSATL